MIKSISFNSTTEIFYGKNRNRVFLPNGDSTDSCSTGGREGRGEGGREEGEGLIDAENGALLEVNVGIEGRCGIEIEGVFDAMYLEALVSA